MPMPLLSILLGLHGLLLLLLLLGVGVGFVDGLMAGCGFVDGFGTKPSSFFPSSSSFLALSFNELHLASQTFIEFK